MADHLAKPVSLKDAIAMVDAWGPDFGFQLHEIARSLREGLAVRDERVAALGERMGELRQERDEYHLKARELATAEGTALDDAEEVRKALTESEQRYADLAERCAEAYEEEAGRIASLESDITMLNAEIEEHERRGLEDEARIGNLLRENEALRRDFEWAADQLNFEAKCGGPGPR